MHPFGDRSRNRRLPHFHGEDRLSHLPGTEGRRLAEKINHSPPGGGIGDNAHTRAPWLAEQRHAVLDNGGVTRLNLGLERDHITIPPQL